MRAVRGARVGSVSVRAAMAIPREYEEHELSDYGWFSGNSGGMTHAVGRKRASAWGLYDMHGNVWEWCQDWYDKDYYAGSPADDPEWSSSEARDRVHRGGGWDDAGGGLPVGVPLRPHEPGGRATTTWASASP